MQSEQRKFDLDPGSEDSGVFLFDEDELAPPPAPLHTASNTASSVVQKPVATCDRDSGVYLPENGVLSLQTPSLPFTSSEDPPLSRAASVSLKRTPSTKSSSSLHHTGSTTRRLHRPADLKAVDTSKPRSELEMRYDLIRNSKTQSKAALRSPTELLKERLNLSPKKNRHEEHIRIFTPPKAIMNGCLMPGPGRQMEAFTSTSIRARTEPEGRPAWWCKFDKLVVFDGVEADHDGGLKFQTRTSKGLSIGRRSGGIETIIVPMECVHCQEMLNRQEWKYEMRVCRRSVCWDCKGRCKWELEA